MINTRALINPSPADENLRTGNRLGMEGKQSYFHGKFYKEFAPENRLGSGGIISLPTQINTNQPFRNELTDTPLPVYDLYHSPLAPQFNPLAVTLDTEFIKKHISPVALKN